MKRIIFRQWNKSILIAVVILLIGTLFFSYVATDIFFNSVSVRRLAEGQSLSQGLVKTVSYVKSGNKLNETGLSYNRISILNQEIVPEKVFINNVKPDFENRWQFSLYFLCVAIALNLLILAVKEWLIKVTRTGRQFIMVHYIQSKDGKKNAASPSFSF